VSRYVVGVEGTLREDAVVIWGAAAIEFEDGVIVNSHSGAKTTAEGAPRLAHEGHLILFRRPPITIRDEHASQPLIVVMVNRQAPQLEHFLVEAGKTGGLVGRSNRKDWLISVFANRVAFNAYAASVADRVSGHVLYSATHSSDANRELIRLALLLSPGSASLNAIRVFQSGSQQGAMHRLARASVRPKEAVHRFELLLTAMRSNADYQIKYEGGVSKDGGFDVDVATRTFKALGTAHNALAPAIKLDYPFLKVIPPPLFHHMVAQSAEMHFKPAIEGKPLGEQIARYLSLHLLEQSLRGEEIEVPKPQQLHAAVQRIANPTPETRVLQKPLAATDREVVVPRLELDGKVAQFPSVDVLGFISGLQKDYQIELSLSGELREKLSITDDGNGATPRGVDAVQRHGDEFLRKPCIASIFSYLDENGDETVYLKEMRLIPPGGSDVVTAIPSGVVEGAYLTSVNLRVTVTAEGVIQTPVGEWPNALTGNLPDARSWLIGYTTAARAFELTQVSAGKWLRAVDVPPASAIQRILVALYALKGRARIPELLVEINRRFQVAVRVNNTRREINDNPLLVNLDETDDQIAQWTAAGEAYYRVYVKAGGQTFVRE
jgi:hypothetical protein